jgi:protein O-GlcNAc transferase
VQVGWFNLYGTSGLDCFDALVGDEHVAPMGEEAFCSEPLVRLPCSYLTFAVEYEVPDVAPPPCRSRGRFTFGCFAPQYKLTPRLLATWATILLGSPASALILQNRALRLSSVREYVWTRFEAAGVPRPRVELRGPAEHFEFLKTYDDVDLALDTYPYNGGTTTAEALWQGVPVLTFPGDRWAARIGASLMRSAGLAEFVAADEGGYVEAAIHTATTPEARTRLAEFRASPREHLRRQSVCDVETLCRSMESTYLRLWRQHRATTAG